jgi:hypothetical protein
MPATLIGSCEPDAPDGEASSAQAPAAASVKATEATTATRRTATERMREFECVSVIMMIPIDRSWRRSPDEWS